MINFGSVLVVKRNGQQVGRRQALKAKIWETHAGCLGLCTGLAVTLFITAGLKDMVGKPRPDMLARCQPDLTNIDRYVIGALGVSVATAANTLVSSDICQQPDKRLLDDGFASFPSGHASFSTAGMVYLTLWLCARWHVAIPFLSYMHQERAKMKVTQAATPAPPLWQVALAFTPIFVALFICSSRYADFHHAGFDIIAGAVLGTTCGWASFRLYHLPLRRSHGLLAWGPRTASAAFVMRVHDDEGLVDEEQGRGTRDVELGGLSRTGVPHVQGDSIASSRRPVLRSASCESVNGKPAFDERVEERAHSKVGDTVK